MKQYAIYDWKYNVYMACEGIFYISLKAQQAADFLNKDKWLSRSRS